MAGSGSKTVSASIIAMLLVVALVASIQQVDAACDGAFLRSQCQDASGFWAPIPINPNCCNAVVSAGASCMCSALKKDLAPPSTILNYIAKCPFPAGTSCQ